MFLVSNAAIIFLQEEWVIKPAFSIFKTQRMLRFISNILIEYCKLYMYKEGFR